MKTRVFLRVAKQQSSRAPVKVVAGAKPNPSPLTDGQGDDLATVAFAIDLEIPDACFRRAERAVASLTIPEAA